MIDWFRRRLGASVQELAAEQLEELLGYQGKEGTGHKPPRPDIAKMEAAYELFQRAYPRSRPESTEQLADQNAARAEWEERYRLNPREEEFVHMYRTLTRHRENKSQSDVFDATVAWMVHNGGFAGKEEDAKRFLGGALKKFEAQHMPVQYQAVKNGLEDLYRMDASSYKLWPWFVKQVKELTTKWLSDATNNVEVNPMGLPSRNPIRDVAHLKDITSQAGALLARLRQENRSPQGMDANKMGFQELEEWLYAWQRDNRETEAQGETVYEFRDGSTIQRLMTPEQLQFEGDEMGHCVGGYSDEVERGDTLIYSLRDKRGQPHATIEMTPATAGRDVYGKPEPEVTGEERDQLKNGLNSPVNDNSLYLFPHLEDESDAKLYNELKNKGRDEVTEEQFPNYAHQKVRFAPEDVRPDEKLWDFNTARPKEGHEFEVIQVQGNSNLTPKPEYQRQIREWLDSLKKNGASFVRSADWYANYDADDGFDEGAWNDGDIEDPDVTNAGVLDDWHDWYKGGGWEQHRGVGEDVYGMKQGPKRIQSGDPGPLMIDCLASLVEHGDRGAYRTSDWRGLADATFHFAVEAGYRREQIAKDLQDAEEKLGEWVADVADQDMGGASQDDLRDKLREKAEERGIDLDELEGTTRWDIWDAVSDHPELQEDMDELRDEAQYEVEKWYAEDAWKYLSRLYELTHTEGSYLGPTGVQAQWGFPHPLHPPQPGTLPGPGDFEKMRDPASVQIPGTFSSWRREAAPPHWEPGMENPPGMPRPIYQGKPVPWTTVTDPEDFEPRSKGLDLPQGEGQFLFERGSTPRIDWGREEGLCVLCGEGLGDPVYFFLDNRINTIVDGGLHKKCLAMTRAHCPHLRDGAADGKYSLAAMAWSEWRHVMAEWEEGGSGAEASLLGWPPRDHGIEVLPEHVIPPDVQFQRLSASLDDALVHYHSPASFELNAALRSGAPLTPEQEETVAQLDAAFEPLPRPMVLYRGVPSKSHIDPGGGYVSTSATPDAAWDFSYGQSGPADDPVILEIAVDAGTPALRVPAGDWGDQDEWLLPRGTRVVPAGPERPPVGPHEPPTQAAHLATTDHPGTMYHTTPWFNADEIAEHGIDWRRQGESVLEGQGTDWPAGNYLSADPHHVVGQPLPEMGEGEDAVFEVDARGLDLETDPYDEVPDGTSWYTPERIPPERLRRIAGRALDPAALKCPATGKQAYADRATAEREVARVRGLHERGLADDRNARPPEQAYECRHCGWWHMTSRRTAADGWGAEEQAEPDRYAKWLLGPDGRMHVWEDPNDGGGEHHADVAMREYFPGLNPHADDDSEEDEEAVNDLVYHAPHGYAWQAGSDRPVVDHYNTRTDDQDEVGDRVTGALYGDLEWPVPWEHIASWGPGDQAWPDRTFKFVQHRHTPGLNAFMEARPGVHHEDMIGEIDPRGGREAWPSYLKGAFSVWPDAGTGQPHYAMDTYGAAAEDELPPFREWAQSRLAERVPELRHHHPELFAKSDGASPRTAADAGPEDWSVDLGELAGEGWDEGRTWPWFYDAPTGAFHVGELGTYHANMPEWGLSHPGVARRTVGRLWPSGRALVYDGFGGDDPAEGVRRAREWFAAHPGATRTAHAREAERTAMGLRGDLPEGLQLAVYEDSESGGWGCTAYLGRDEVGHLTLMRDGTVESVAVEPEWQRMGVARAMKEELERSGHSVHHDWDNLSAEGWGWASADDPRAAEPYAAEWQEAMAGPDPYARELERQRTAGVSDWGADDWEEFPEGAEYFKWTHDPETGRSWVWRTTAGEGQPDDGLPWHRHMYERLAAQEGWPEFSKRRTLNGMFAGLHGGVFLDESYDGHADAPVDAEAEYARYLADPVSFEPDVVARRHTPNPYVAAAIPGRLWLFVHEDAAEQVGRDGAPVGAVLHPAASRGSAGEKTFEVDPVGLDLEPLGDGSWRACAPVPSGSMHRVVVPPDREGVGPDRRAASIA